MKMADTLKKGKNELNAERKLLLRQRRNRKTKGNQKKVEVHPTVAVSTEKKDKEDDGKKV